MGDAGMASGAPDAPDCSASRARCNWGERRGRAEIRGDLAARHALDRLCTAHYKSLVRLAALLTGDMLLAEQIAADSLIAVMTSSVGTQAAERVLFRLRRQVVTKSRHIVRINRGSHGSRPLSQETQDSASGWETAPVIRLLGSLSTSQREALVLRHYLDLGEDETAALTGSSRHAVRRSLASAMAAFEAAMPEASADSG